MGQLVIFSFIAKQTKLFHRVLSSVRIVASFFPTETSWASFCSCLFFCPADACPSHFSVPLYLTLLPLCVSCHSAIWCWWQIHHPESPVPSSVTDLLHHVVQHEDTIMEGIKKSLENPPPSVSDVSESMESLEVDQADPSCCGEGCNKAECCKRGEQMDLDVQHQPQRLSSGSADWSLNSGESLNILLQRCMDLVSEFGLPLELISHIQDLKTI